MNEEFFILIIFNLLVIGFLYYYKTKLKNFATKQDIREISYEQQKGMNLATKEDIKQITKDIESVKTDFQTYINEQQIKFSVLHQERAKFLMNLYSKLIKLNSKVTNHFRVAMNSNDKERDKILEESNINVDEVETFYFENSILIEDNIGSIIINHFDDLKISIKRLHTGLSIEKSGFIDKDNNLSDKGTKMIENVIKKIEEDFPEILEKIKYHFQELLGLKIKYY
jgi:hypothetical protein